MLHEAGYDIIPLYSATKGMNQNIAANLLNKDEFSYYIENILPDSLGEGQVRYGNNFLYAQPDNVVEAFPFEYLDDNATLHHQQVIYFSGYEDFDTAINVSIYSSNKIILTSLDYTLFKVGDNLLLNYTDQNGTHDVAMEILVLNDELENDVIITVDYDFPDDLVDFYIPQVTASITYISNNSFSFVVPDEWVDLRYELGLMVKLTVNSVEYPLVVSEIVFPDDDNTVTLTFTTNTVPVFAGGDTVSFTFKSLTPRVNTIKNATGYIKVYDKVSDAFLEGEDQTLDNLSTACLPRSEYFGGKLWICNGVDPVMTWDGVALVIYEEPVKENANTFGRTDNTHFTFIAGAGFNLTKYAVGNVITLSVAGISSNTTVVASADVDNLITIETTDELPEFDGSSDVELFYYDKPPPFSYMKGALDRLWCLPPGAVRLDYRPPSDALRVYYSYFAYTDVTPFRFFNETTKTVPSEDISAKHGGADNLEAIVNISGHLAFIGRQKTQVWHGNDPLTENSPNSFGWSSTIPVGVYHGNLLVELANDAYFLNQNGFLSFGTLNIARQFAANTTADMDKIALAYIDTIKTDTDYRACRSFKYKSGGFCGFKIGKNNIITSLYHTSLYWWAILSGDFALSSTFLSTADGYLCLYINNRNVNDNYNNTFVYADKVFTKSDNSTLPVAYADNNGQNHINFSETKYVNNIKSRFANKRYEVQADYSSNIVINPENKINVYIRGDLRDSFIITDLYEYPVRGDVLGTINLVGASGANPNNPSAKALGLRLDKASHVRQGRLQFVSSNFSVSLVGKVKNGPFSMKKIRLLGIAER